MNSRIIPAVAAGVLAVALMYVAFAAVPPSSPATGAPKVAPVLPVPDAAPKKPAPRCPNCPRNWISAGMILERGPCPGRSLYLPVAIEADDEVQVDLLAMPSSLRPKNTGGSDGAGLCVFTSVMYAARWQNEDRLKNFQAQMRAERGGGWPQKLDAMILKYGPGTKYIQYEGTDPAIIEAALKTGRLPCITWQANHMLCCVGLTGTVGVILDNNAPDKVQTFPRDTFLRKWTQGGRGWVVVLLAPPPAPPPAGVVRPKIEAAKACPCSALCSCGCNDGQPCRCGEPGTHPYLAGVLWATNPLPRGYSVDGKRTGAATALALLGADLPNEAGQLRLTVIGGGRDKVLADLESAPALSPWKGRVLVQGYDPADPALGWAVRDHVTTGSPTIYLQKADGTVLLRRDTYDGPEDLAARLRRRDPTYDPKSDPDGSALGTPSLSEVPEGSIRGATGAAAIAAVAGVVHLIRRRRP